MRGEKKMKMPVILAVSLAVLMFLLTSCGSGPTGLAVAEKKVDVTLFAMSQCPYGVMAEQDIEPVMIEFKDFVNYRIEYIVSENPDGTFRALHGEPEVKGNIIQLCVQKHDQEKFIEFLSCVNKDAQNIPDNWEFCAEKLSLDIEILESCYVGDEGKQLLRESAEKAQEKKVSGSPTIFINGELYQGGRAEKNFKQVVCSHLKTHPSCKDLPECSSDIDCPQKKDKIVSCVDPDSKDAKCVYEDAKPFDILILTSSKCINCNAELIAQSLSGIPGSKVKVLDIEELEGKSLVEQLSIEKLPAILFSKIVKETQFWKMQPAELEQMMEDKGDWLKFPDTMTGADFFVSEEKKQELLERIGIPGDKPIVDVFLMSYCPYGNDAVEIVNNLFSLFGYTVEFRPKYIIYENYAGGGADYCLEEGTLCSMHGIQELNQNIRELCVFEKEGMRGWLPFARKMSEDCNYNNADTCWEGVAEKLKLDIDYIKECQIGKGIELIKEHKQIGNAFGITESPTILINGERYGGNRTPEAIKQAICETFAEHQPACDIILDNTVETTSEGSC